MLVWECLLVAVCQSPQADWAPAGALYERQREAFHRLSFLFVVKTVRDAGGLPSAPTKTFFYGSSGLSVI